jgi:hypothetical protein
MKIVAVEWGSGESPETMIETYSVAATMEAILLARVADKQEVVEAFLQQYKD